MNNNNNSLRADFFNAKYRAMEHMIKLSCYDFNTDQDKISNEISNVRFELSNMLQVLDEAAKEIDGVERK